MPLSAIIAIPLAALAILGGLFCLIESRRRDALKDAWQAGSNQDDPRLSAEMNILSHDRRNAL